MIYCLGMFKILRTVDGKNGISFFLLIMYKPMKRGKIIKKGALNITIKMILHTIMEVQ